MAKISAIPWATSASDTNRRSLEEEEEEEVFTWISFDVDEDKDRKGNDPFILAPDIVREQFDPDDDEEEEDVEELFDNVR